MEHGVALLEVEKSDHYNPLIDERKVKRGPHSLGMQDKNELLLLHVVVALKVQAVSLVIYLHAEKKGPREEYTNIPGQCKLLILFYLVSLKRARLENCKQGDLGKSCMARTRGAQNVDFYTTYQYSP